MNLHEELAAKDSLITAQSARIAELETQIKIQVDMPTADEFLARILPPPGYEGHIVIEREGKLQWCLRENLRPDDQLCFYDGDARKVATPDSAPAASPVEYGPDNPPRLRKPGESVEEYRIAMGWPVAPEVADTDIPEALELLAAVFDAWENGDDCYEDPEECAGFLGKAFRLDDDIFNRCVELLNRRNPPRNATSTAVQAPVREVPEPQGWREAMQEFVDRCERGEILSRYTYAKFKALLAPLPAALTQTEDV